MLQSYSDVKHSVTILAFRIRATMVSRDLGFATHVWFARGTWFLNLVLGPIMIVMHALCLLRAFGISVSSHGKHKV